MSYSRFWRPRSPIALALGIACVAMGQSDAPAKVEPSSSGRQAASLPSAPGASANARNNNTHEITVPGESVWTDAGFDLHTGDKVVLTATGTVQFPLGQEVGPNGTDTVGVGGQDVTLPVSGAPHGAFIARIGEAGTGLVFLAGAMKTIEVSSPGRLYLGINEYQPGETHGSFKANVEIDRGGANRASQSDAALTSLFPAQILANIPRRASTSRGQPEDLVNLFILGTEQQMKLTFQAAGWAIVARTDTGAITSRGALQSLSEESYVGRPLSELYLFGRPQDFSYAHSELVTVVNARHYLRIWRDPSDVNQQTLWIGAAAHDIGPWWNSRTGEVSYKIDPRVDGEREYVRDSLNETGLVERFGYVKFSAKGRRGRTSAGSSRQTDGRALVVTLLNLANR